MSSNPNGPQLLQDEDSQAFNENTPYNENTHQNLEPSEIVLKEGEYVNVILNKNENQ